MKISLNREGREASEAPMKTDCVDFFLALNNGNALRNYKNNQIEKKMQPFKTESK